MRVLEPDGSPSEATPASSGGKPVWRVPRDKLALIEAAGSTSVIVETPDAEAVLEPGGDYLIVAKERYLRLVTELGVFRDFERRALSSMSRRKQRRQERDPRP